MPTFVSELLVFVAGMLVALVAVMVLNQRGGTTPGRVRRGPTSSTSRRRAGTPER